VNEHTKLVLSSGIHSIAVESEQPLRIQKGEKILLQGSFKACQRLLRELDYRGDYSLKVTINETPIVQLDEASTKSKFGWIDHLPHILSDTFYENIKYNTQADTLNIFEAAKACGLEVLFQNEQELIYSTTHHREEIWTLENRARLECARALVLNPEVLIIRNEFVLRSEDLIQMLIEKLPNTTLIAFSNNQLTIPQFKSIQLS
jgi:ABC-type transport system involved in cytochrome bd biosynthesis fused ATPase/permease subunit